MIRGKYLRERKAIRFKRRIKLLICLLIVMILYKIVFSSYSLYESEANSTFEAEVAFFVLEDTNLTKTVTLDDLQPGETTSCSFSIANYITESDDSSEVGKIAETDIIYNLTIKTTTNLPLEYELYLNDNPSTNSSAVDLIDGNYSYIQDSDDTYFNKIFEYENTFKHDVEYTDTYILVITFPKGTTEDPDVYMNYTYQDIMDAIEISVDAKQIIDDDTTNTTTNT